ncbi:relaxase/mobilization nuclease domain-containing protein [Pedobacter sp. KR3-3]|uniref:Relaxase/mobilization nuclease domain-containing protein n=1 Tax=Pedobacter albus TaxID=3113905 RepID=A0ABU7ICP9_9SPHI|nr:relaxase/mobilization nuclease domain-containing protein [Pedobacter sp. KR3-3]MEE1947250.1 relaxase/mobilization nuclease domain-containing protein [Pedobacter sp. KR3-3]
MVARIITGKSIRGVLSYNENKVADSAAALLLISGFPCVAGRLSFKRKLERFQKLTRQNEMTKTNAVHISLNFSKDDILEAGDLKRIAIDYMRRIGFGDQPFLVYQHFDAPHPHIHIATVNIADGGKRIETHNIGRNQSEKARKEIEIEYGLIIAENQRKDVADMLSQVNLEKAIYGKAATKAAISGIVQEVTGSYKFTSLPELNAVLRQFNVLADRGSESSAMYKNKGLVYSLLDEKGNKVGVPIKASTLYGSPTIKNLEKKFIPNDIGRKPYGLRLKHLLDKALSTARSAEELKAQLQAQGIRILLRENAQGQIYGVTFIDNATRVVFNGSDLGKTYSAKAFLERLPAGTLEDRIVPEGQSGPAKPVLPDTGIPDKEKKYPACDQPVVEKLIDMLLSAASEPTQADPFRRKKKRRLLS